MRVNRVAACAVMTAAFLIGCGKAGSSQQGDCSGGACARVSAVAIGDYHGCALTDAATVKCWGSNGWGQLGDGSFVGSTVPVNVRGLTDATAVAVGMNHSCALRPGGAFWCWGANDQGQLGDGTKTNRPDPVFAATIAGATRLAVGTWHNCAIAGGAVRCWGYGGSGQLGNGSFASSIDEPVSVSSITDATAISANGDFTCAVVESGRVKCWGIGLGGALGNGTTSNSADPVYVQSVEGATAIAAGLGHTCAIVSGGAIKCWGGNNFGQLGNVDVPTDWNSGSATPVDVTGLSGALSIFAGPLNTCAVLAGGTAWCWGDNRGSKLGVPSTTVSLSAEPLAYPGLAGVDEVGIGDRFACARLGTRVKCWGHNGEGQLGAGTTTDSLVPVDVRF